MIQKSDFKTQYKILLIIAIVLILAILILKVFNVQKIILKKMYPLNYSEEVYKYSEQYEVDPLLIFSIIKAESNFEEAAISKSNAKGLMQLMEETAEEIAKKNRCGISKRSNTI